MRSQMILELICVQVNSFKDLQTYNVENQYKKLQFLISTIIVETYKTEIQTDKKEKRQKTFQEQLLRHTTVQNKITNRQNRKKEKTFQNSVFVFCFLVDMLFVR
jgi:hypothetical protein